jgi:hypothetical protein
VFQGELVILLQTHSGADMITPPRLESRQAERKSNEALIVGMGVLFLSHIDKIPVSLHHSAVVDRLIGAHSATNGNVKEASLIEQ